MVDKPVLIFLLLDFLFLCSGGLLLAVGLVFSQARLAMTMSKDAAIVLLLQQTPLTAAIANAVLVFVTFLASIPGIISTKPYFMRVHTWFLVISAILTLVVGLDIWYSTLRTRANLANLWVRQTTEKRSLLQNQFNCCGYMSSTSFVVDAVCTDDVTAVRLGGCIGPFGTYANEMLDVVFTAVFGIAALDGFLFLAAVVVLKVRAEKERYRLIDQKSGFDGI